MVEWCGIIKKDEDRTAAIWFDTRPGGRRTTDWGWALAKHISIS